MRRECNMCGREGVLIYPLRYAVACPNGVKNIPDLPKNFFVANAPSDITPAKYTLRSLRSGYLYTYDEKRGQLKAYVVFVNGGLWEFPLSYPPSFDEKHAPQPCTDPVDIALSRCIDIRHTDADPAGFLWVGWSNSRWTKKLISQASDAGWRRLHMQCIDIPAMLARPVHHASSFTSMINVIPHFALGGQEMRSAFRFSSYGISKELMLKNWARRASLTFERYSSSHGGYIVALNDPIGILSDLSELLLPTVHAGLDESCYRANIVSNLIYTTEYSYKSELRRQALEERKKEAEGSANPFIDKHYKYKDVFGKFSREKQKDRLNSQNSQIESAIEKEWMNLIRPNGRPILDEAALRAWQPKYASALHTFKPIADRLASLHAAWLRSIQLRDWMLAVHDDNDITSGVAFRESLAQCIGYGAMSEPCTAVLTGWLSTADPSDLQNLYARALLFNNKSLIDYTAPRLKDSDVPLEGIFNIYKKAVELAGQGNSLNTFDRLLLATASIISENATNLQNRPMSNIVVIGLSLTAEIPVRRSERSVNAIQSWIVSEAMGSVHNQNLLSLNVAARKAAEEILQRRSTNPANFALELDMSKLRQQGRVSANAVNIIDIPNANSLEGWLASSTTPLDFRLGVVTIILQMIALSFSLRDLHNNDDANRFETRLKSCLAAVTLSASLVEIAMATVKASSIHPLSMYIHTHWSFAARNSGHFGKFARVLGGAAGVVAGCFDIYKGWNTFNSGNKLLGSAQMSAGAGGIALGILTIAGLVAFGWVLVFAVIVGFVIPLLSPSPLQEWLGRCYFGVENPKYQSVDEELSAYRSAVGG